MQVEGAGARVGGEEPVAPPVPGNAGSRMSGCAAPAGPARWEVDRDERLWAEQNDAAATPWGRSGEAQIAEVLEKVPPGGRASLDLSEAVPLGATAAELKGKLKASIERRPDGAYVARLGGGLAIGLGLDASLDVGSKSDGSGPGAKAGASLGGELGVAVRFGSAKEAADKLTALAEVSIAALADPMLPLPVAGSLLPDADAGQRIASMNDRVVQLEGALELEAGLEVDAGLAEAGLKVSAKATVTIDLEQRLVLVDREVASGAGIKPTGAISNSASVSFLDGLQARRTELVRTVHPLPPDGKLSLSDVPKLAVAALSVPPERVELIQRIEGKRGDIGYLAERRESPPGFPPGLGTPATSVQLTRAGGVFGIELDLVVAELSIAARLEQAVAVSEAPSLVRAVLDELERGRYEVDAARASARMSR